MVDDEHCSKRQHNLGSSEVLLPSVWRGPALNANEILQRRFVIDPYQTPRSVRTCHERNTTHSFQSVSVER